MRCLSNSAIRAPCFAPYFTISIVIVSDYEALISGGFVRRPPPVET